MNLQQKMRRQEWQRIKLFLQGQLYYGSRTDVSCGKILPKGATMLNGLVRGGLLIFAGVMIFATTGSAIGGLVVAAIGVLFIWGGLTYRSR